jgi:hypothetical protein
VLAYKLKRVMNILGVAGTMKAMNHDGFQGRTALTVACRNVQARKGWYVIRQHSFVLRELNFKQPPA